MDQIRIAADSSCDLLTMDGVDFVSVPLTVRTAVEEFRDDAALDVDAMVEKGETYLTMMQKNADTLKEVLN